MVYCKESTCNFFKDMVDHKITFTYLNIRQSIVILLARLMLLDIFTAGIVIGLYFLLVRGEQIMGSILTNPSLFLNLFIIIGIVKILINIYVILQWLNEYYEITPDHIYHKRGIIFRKTEQYRIDHVRSMDVQDTFLGEIFNYATITLYDIRLNKYLDLYNIHNPQRYAHVLKELRPNIEMKKDRVHLPFMPKEEKGIRSEFEENA